WAKAFWISNGDKKKFSDLLEGDELKKFPYPEGIKLSSNMPRFPKGQPREGTAALAGLEANLCVSFSGLKTALLYYVKQNPPQDDYEKAMIVASYQEAIVNALVDRTKSALKKRAYKALIVGGGVSLNARLRSALKVVAEKARIPLLLAEPKFCGDNAAMIAGLAHWRQNISGDDALSIDVNPSLPI
ncbi:MAG: hypothetical protein J6V88_04685, partial [Kiritimatiellae bacterium]|nr:hypothetical protein [Kiritimatiellia bacterium]